jgi:hypothetical protein
MEVESHTALPLMPRSSPFPEEWGTPPAGVDERRGWMIRNIGAGEVRARRGGHVPWLNPKLRRPLSGREALRRLDVRVATRTGSGCSRSSSSRRARDDALSAHARGPRRRSPGGLGCSATACGGHPGTYSGVAAPRRGVPLWPSAGASAPAPPPGW